MREKDRDERELLFSEGDRCRAAHHSEELLRQRVVGEKVKLRGVLGECGVGGRGVVEPSPQRQVLPQQLHVVLYPL